MEWGMEWSHDITKGKRIGCLCVYSTGIDRGFRVGMDGHPDDGGTEGLVLDVFSVGGQ